MSQESGTSNITTWLLRWRAGDEAALPQISDAVYRELRRLAGAMFRNESPGHTLQPTALVHELYLQLPEMRDFDWKSRAQFYSVAARMMRNILVDHARSRRAQKRGAGLEVDMPEISYPGLNLDVLVVHQALQRFSADHERQAQVVELRFFGGLTADETAEVLRQQGVDCSLRTVERDWRFARAWLQDAIAGSSDIRE
jgi:RNA polymerase sigma factor (TIGR02999 family)